MFEELLKARLLGYSENILLHCVQKKERFLDSKMSIVEGRICKEAREWRQEKHLLVQEIAQETSDLAIKLLCTLYIYGSTGC